MKSKDGTIKYLIQIESGSIVEMVRIPSDNRQTLCISSQAGCALQCSFCATGAQGFEVNLSASEIIGQLWLASFHDEKLPPITNIVFWMPGGRASKRTFAPGVDICKKNQTIVIY